ncbi:D-isomer specific 2-hydroxyacid dehydrogenase family protein [Williamsia sp. D3]|uniref:D-isomer specific 2-hydroxyacid dehydrogenase family protein n=1 Tax=Williamsia sp. D3 TaxID=1313067 RepID=UPI0003D39066|nr:D-isomer specific 2-hydroxyacid dehydrogenase family protein [Williamsia sp. D3]ETD34561.1 2-hydroxyacid dehydrogenase [Williamsia sp. D3]
MTAPIPVALLPHTDSHLSEAITSAGGTLADLADARALVWVGNVDGFPEPLPDSIEWVQLRLAGIESFLRAGLLDDRRIWTNASGFYAENVAEHALALLLAGLRQINVAVLRHWDEKAIDPAVRSLHGSTVGIIGAGGIARSLIPRLKACGAQAIAVNRSGRPVEGASKTLPASRIDEVWGLIDHVVLAAPATDETRHLINARTLAALPRHAWLINVARGPLVDEAALRDALLAGEIAGAALDVTDPEPPDANDPLWDLENVIITPHVANPSAGLTRTMAPWLAENLRRFAAGGDMLAVVHPDASY